MHAPFYILFIGVRNVCVAAVEPCVFRAQGSTLRIFHLEENFMKRILSLFLSLTTVISMLNGINLWVQADSNDINVSESEQEYIFYSDLFYGYPYYLANDSYFKDYSTSTKAIYNGVLSSYQNSSLVVGTGLEHALDTITSPTEITKLITDTLGLTEFSYNDALDAANDEFVRNILSESSAYDTEKAFGKTASFCNKINAITTKFNKLGLESENGQISYTAEYYVQEAFDYLQDQGFLDFISDGMLTDLWVEINSSDFSLNSCFNLASTEIDIAKALVTSIMMEDHRLEIINEIISTQSNNTVLKQGMTRLKSQLQGSFVSYFIKNYLTEKLADKVFGEIDKMIVNAVSGKEISALLGIAKMAFNTVVEVPSFEDVLKWQVLICYSNDLADAIPNLAASFSNGPFLSNEIIKYENMFTAYDAINKAAMSASESVAKMDDPFGEAYSVLIEAANSDIEKVTIKSGGVAVSIPSTTSSSDLYAVMLGTKTLSTATGGIFAVGKNIEISNGKKTVKVPVKANILSSVMQDGISENWNLINHFKAQYDNTNLYGEHIYSVKKTISFIPSSERQTLSKENWTYTLNSGTVIYHESDEILPNSIYCVDKKLYGNVIVKGDLKLPQENTTYIIGNVEIKTNLTVSNYTNIVIYGNVKTSYKTHLTIATGASLTVNGTTEIISDSSLTNSGALFVHVLRIWYRCCVTNNGEIQIQDTLDCSGALSATIHNYKKIQTNNCLLNCSTTNFLASDDSTIYVSGAFSGWNLLTGTIIFDGTNIQEVNRLKATRIIVENIEGLKYLSDIHIYGLYKLNGNPVFLNGYKTLAYDGARFDDSFYDTISAVGLTLVDNLNANIEVVKNTTLTIPEQHSVTITGNVHVWSDNHFTNNGSLTILGNMNVWYRCCVTNNGEMQIDGLLNCGNALSATITNNRYLKTKGNVTASSSTSFKMTDFAEWHICADYKGSHQSIMKGNVYFDGDKKQTIEKLSASTVVINNTSVDGVVFITRIHIYKLLDHKGNNFSLYDSSSTLVDYDGDGLKDNVDPEPTVGNLCTVNFEAINGNVSTNSIETIGGQIVTVIATPSDNAVFSKWIDSSGKTVSTEATYEFVATKNDIYTAVFNKLIAIKFVYNNKTLHILNTVEGEELTPEQLAEVGALIPEIFGYEFVGWDSDISEPVYADKVFKAVYSRKTDKDFTLNVTDSSGDKEIAHGFDEFVTVNAEAENFLCWKDAVSGTVMSLTPKYSFYMPGNISLVAVYKTSPEDKAELPIATMNSTVNTVDGGDTYNAIFTAKVNLPKGAELIEKGVIFTNDTGYALGKEAFDLSLNPAIVRASKLNTAGNYMITLTEIAKGARRYARAYATYTLNGKTYTAYSDYIANVCVD